MWDNMQLFLGAVLIAPAIVSAAAGIVIVFLLIAIHAATVTVESESP